MSDEVGKQGIGIGIGRLNCKSIDSLAQLDENMGTETPKTHSVQRRSGDDV